MGDSVLRALVVLAALASGASVASAQDTPPVEAPPAEAPPTEEATPVAPTAPPDDDPRHAEALARFDDAAALFERGDHAGALAEMEAVYALLEGREDQYVVFYNLGRIYEALHRYDRAIDLYERYLRESPESGADRADAQASLRALERFLGTLVIAVDVPAEVWLGEVRVGDAPGELRIPAGAHTLELRAAGYEPHRREVEVAARTRVEVAVRLARLSDFHGISPVVFAITGAAALVALGAGIGLGAHAMAQNDAGLECARRDACGEPDAAMDTVAQVALAADLLYGGALLLAATSVVLAFVTDWGGTRGDPEQARVIPVVAPGAAGVVITGAL